MSVKFNPLIFGGFDLSGGGGPAGAVQWKQPVANEASLPTVGNAPGDARVVLDTDKIYVWDDTSSKWVDSKLTTALFGATPNAAGITVSSVTVGDITRPTINLEPADATNPGAVSILAQTFAGDKTFNNKVTVEQGINAKGGIDSSTNTLTIGATADNINIGGPGATVTIQGDTTYEHVTNLIVKDKTITLNDGGAAGSAGGAGIEIEEDVLGTQQITGYAQVSSDRNAWELKAPNQAGVAVIDPGALGITIDQSSHDPITLGAVGSTPNLNGATLSGQILNLEPADSTNPGVISTGPQSFAGDKTFDNDVIVTGNLQAKGGVDHPASTLQIGLNSTTVEIGAPTEFNGNQITEVGSLTLEKSTNDEIYASIYTNNGIGPGSDTAYVSFAEAGPGLGEISYATGGNLSVSSSTSLNITSPDINIGDAVGTTDIVGTVTIEYNPADPTDWAPAPTHVIEAIDQLAERFVEQDQVTNEPTGFPNRTDSVVLFNDGGGTPTFTIQPAVTSYDVYIRGKKYTKTAAETVTTVSHPSFPYAGNNYFYFDQNGDLQVTNTFTAAIIQQYAFISIVYWNPDTNSHTYFAEERHGLTMDGVTHSYLHTVFGARYLSGLALQNFTIGTGGANADAQFDVDQGSIRDEDILLQIAAQPQIPILYRLGSNSYWRKKPADTFPLIYSGTAGYTGANGRLPYNQFSGGSWSLTEVSNNKYVLVHFFATNDKENGVVGIQGIAEYDSMEAARTGANNEITSLSGLPFAEFVPIGTVLFQTANTFANIPKADVIPVDGANYVDFRGTQLYTPAGTATTHGLLSGLGNDDHFQYLLADGTRAMSGDLSMGGNDITDVVSLNNSGNLTLNTPNILALNGGSVSASASVGNVTLTSGLSQLEVSDPYVILNPDTSTKASNKKIIDLADPTDPQDAATKIYVDGKVADSITDGVTTIAPSQNAVFDALALKQDVGNYITDLTGEVTASGPGSVAATITANAVTNAKLAQMPASTLKGNNTALPADPTDLTVSDVRTLLSILPSYSGDISRTTFTALDNTAIATNITNLLFSNATVRGFDVILTVERGATYAEYSLKGIQKGASWEMSQDYIGDETGIVFSITSAGQIQYTTTSTGDDADLKFRAMTV